MWSCFHILLIRYTFHVPVQYTFDVKKLYQVINWFT
ncbi:hypothetical protein HERIO_2789 [Hepatospora eriocheir]|uniref:Uncharacterized protein n=1 Tax=Hepatospora eriocheir TaxID=1081669 RepID=A0A1X0Q6K4_9MICR|nr:hypothetical protein HERIO_2789 [Hepatospora eriocheir]